MCALIGPARPSHRAALLSSDSYGREGWQVAQVLIPVQRLPAWLPDETGFS